MSGSGGTDFVGPGGTIGILGAGQLGRMLAIRARQMGYRIAVFGGDRTSPTGQVCDHCWPGNYDDEDQLREFAEASDVVTYEFENIPLHAAEFIDRLAPVRPQTSLLKAAQNRFLEKTALRNSGLRTAPFRMIHSAEELSATREEFGGKVILKSNTAGYDGKGQWSINASDDVDALWKSTGLDEAIVEQKIDFEFELSVIGGRFATGDVQLYDPFLNHHANHILDVTVSGSDLITDSIATEAKEMATAVLEHFGVVGVLCLELFLTADGQLLVNEIAPRPHNSGHLTIEAYNCSQFELQLRTVCGLPVVPLERRSKSAAMANLLGQHLPEVWSAESVNSLANHESHLHLYGKGEARENRKVGHLTVLASDFAAAEASARSARDHLLT